MVKVGRDLRERFAFFQEHAGYIIGERARCALHLARAELAAEDSGWAVEWEWEQDIDDSWMSEAERAKDHEWTCALLKDAGGNVLASLGGICDADRTYRRVVEAELADEALASERHEVRKARECAACLAL